MSEDADIKTEFQFSMPAPEEVSALMAEKMRLAVDPFLSKIMSEAKKNLGRDGTIRTGLLKRALAKKTEIRVERKVENKKTIVSRKLFAIAGVNRKVTGLDENGRKIRPSRYSHLANSGTAPRKNSKGQNRGYVEPTFFDRAIAQAGGTRKLNEDLKTAVISAMEESKK